MSVYLDCGMSRVFDCKVYTFGLIVECLEFDCRLYTLGLIVECL